MSLKELEKFTFTSRYARYLPDKKRRETWKEAVDRCRNMMLEKYAGMGVEEEIDWAYDQVQQKKVLGSQRALQFGGKPILEKNERLYNCCASYVDRPRFFQECLFLLLCGVGVGFSVQKHHIDKLPNLIGHKEGSKKFAIPDSIEGWSDAIGILVCSYFEQDNLCSEFVGKNITFDYSKIRPKGSYLSSTSGKAPGPEPLKNSVNKIRKLLDLRLKEGNKKLRPIDAYDIVMHLSDCVLSGGCRRSACLCMFSHDDEEMYNAKIGNWFHENSQRARSNNSAVLLRNQTTPDEFSILIQSTKQFAEPGFVWTNNSEQIYNPCLEIGLYGYDEFGNSGFQFCNLSEINIAKCKEEQDFFTACKAAAIIGTLQAGFTNFPYLGEVTERITRQEALLGVSMTGIMEHPELSLNPEIQRNGAKIVKNVNKEIAKKININPAARTTCIKPSGTASTVLGVSSGIHPHHAKRYIRRVQTNKEDEIYKHFRHYNSSACEESVWSANSTDDVVAFCIEVPHGSKTKNQLSAIEMLEYVKLTQQNWVKYGKDDGLCVKPWLMHNVSNTIIVKPEEWDDVEKYIYDNREFFCGISLVPQSGDKDYAQAPNATVYLPHEIVSEYGNASLLVSGLIEQSLELYEDNLWLACDVLLGLNAKPKGNSKLGWFKRCQKFADKYFEGNIRRLTYLMKDVHTWKYWVDLQREYKPVNYEEMIEETDNVNFEMEPACAGGVCSL